MKECFGLQMAFGPEGMAPEDEDRQRCFDCEDFEKCYKYSMVRALHGLRFEIRKGSDTIRRALGGRHTEQPFW